jgi:hypothetical protein
MDLFYLFEASTAIFYLSGQTYRGRRIKCGWRLEEELRIGLLSIKKPV